MTPEQFEKLISAISGLAVEGLIVIGMLIAGLLYIPSLVETNRLLEEIKNSLEVIEKRGRK